MLWEQLKSGQRKALESIYNINYDSLVYYGKGLCPDIELVEDAIHDVFVKIWTRRENLSQTDNVKAYLLVSVRHKILKLLKKNSKIEPNVEDKSFSTEEASVEDHIIEEEFRIEMSGKLKNAFNVLSQRQRQAIYLRYQESMEYEDICRLMEINYQSVRNLISSGIKKLAVDLKKKL